jgi:hypothetical protein
MNQTKPQSSPKKQPDYGMLICVVFFLIFFFIEVTHEQMAGIVPYLIFFMGLMTGTLLALTRHLDKKTLTCLGGGPLLWTLIMFMPGKHENNYGQHLHSHALMALGAYLIFFPLYLRKQLLAAVNGQVSLYFTILFWYLLVTNYASVSGYFPIPVLILLGAGTLVCAYFSLWHEFLLTPLWRLGLYAWYLAILLLITLLQLSRLSLSDLVDGVASGWEMYLGGINATFMAINIGVVVGLLLSLLGAFSFLPITSNKERLKRGLDESLGKMGKQAQELETKYLDRYLPPAQLFLLFVVQGTLFVLNDQFHFIPQILLTYLIVALASLGLALAHRLR